MATAALKRSLTGRGMNQGDLWQAIENLVNIVNELQTDHTTTMAAVDGVLAKLDADGGITDTDYAAVHGTGGSGGSGGSRGGWDGLFYEKWHLSRTECKRSFFAASSICFCG